MKILIIGGTQFVGRHLAAEILERDHELTLFHRGQTNPGLFPEANEVLGDRMDDLELLDGQWDVVIDTCGYFPKQVRLSGNYLADKVGRYAFISTISVYRDFYKEGIDESGYVKTLEDPEVEELNWTTYGPLKTECEGVIDGIYQDRAFVIRPGVIAGPWDSTDRFTYWAWRVAQGGKVLAPGPAQANIQLIDARDLASWVVEGLEAGRHGTYNAAGPKQSFSAMLEACRRGAGVEAEFVWAPPEKLQKWELDDTQKMPLWNPEGDDRKAGIYAVDSSKAITEGLTYRPLEETARDTLAWAESCVEDHDWQVGLDLLKEQEYVRSLIDE